MDKVDFEYTRDSLNSEECKSHYSSSNKTREPRSLHRSFPLIILSFSLKKPNPEYKVSQTKLLVFPKLSFLYHLCALNKITLIKLSEIITIRQQADLISKVRSANWRKTSISQQKCNNGIRLAELSGSTVWRSWFPNNKRHIPRLVNCAISMSNEVICEADRLLLRYAGGATRWLLPDKRDHSSSLSQRENNVASLERCPSPVNLQFSSTKIRWKMELIKIVLPRILRFSNRAWFRDEKLSKACFAESFNSFRDSKRDTHLECRF